jgi:hypothetical protein
MSCGKPMGQAGKPNQIRLPALCLSIGKRFVATKKSSYLTGINAL